MAFFCQLTSTINFSSTEHLAQLSRLELDKEIVIRFILVFNTHFSLHYIRQSFFPQIFQCSTSANESCILASFQFCIFLKTASPFFILDLKCFSKCLTFQNITLRQNCHLNGTNTERLWSKSKGHFIEEVNFK